MMVVYYGKQVMVAARDTVSTGGKRREMRLVIFFNSRPVCCKLVLPIFRVGSWGDSNRKHSPNRLAIFEHVVPCW